MLFGLLRGGTTILFILAVLSRLWAPVDLTTSTTVKAPHAVVSPLLGERIDQIYVDHNQMVKKGDVLYTLIDTDSSANLAKIELDLVKQQETIEQMQRDIGACREVA